MVILEGIRKALFLCLHCTGSDYLDFASMYKRKPGIVDCDTPNADRLFLSIPLIAISTMQKMVGPEADLSHTTPAADERMTESF